MSDLVGNLEDLFSHVEAHVSLGFKEIMQKPTFPSSGCQHILQTVLDKLKIKYKIYHMNEPSGFIARMGE